MKKISNILFWWVIMILFIFFISGCCSVANFGEPENRTGCEGTVVVPKACKDKKCNQLQETSVPLTSAQVTLHGSNKDIVYTQTDDRGKWVVSDLISPYYLLEAVKNNIIVKQVISIQLGTINQAGEANVYTTCQVLVYEVANQLFENALYLDEVPDLVIPESMVEMVENVYRECRNPFCDSEVIAWVKDLIPHQF